MHAAKLSSDEIESIKNSFLVKGDDAFDTFSTREQKLICESLERDPECPFRQFLLSMK